jgi:DNA-binding NarL/FixJ family response regulator
MATVRNDQAGIEVIAQASNGREAVTAAQKLRPDVCLLDIRMPVLDGIEATRLLAGPDVADPVVVVITTFDTDEYVYGALKAGARGFLLKGASPDQLANTIHAAAAGDALIDPAVTARLLANFARQAPAIPVEPLHNLTGREEDVLMAVASGKSNSEVGKDLYISVSTVKFHVASLMTKIGARNRVESAIWAYETGRLRGEG